MPPSRSRKRPTSRRKSKKRVVSQNVIHPSRALPLHRPDLQLFLKHRLTVAIYADFYPVAYWNKETQTFEGLDVDILRSFSEAVGLKPPKFVRADDYWDLWEKPGQWEPKVDVSIGGIGRNDMRELSNIEWTLPYFRVQRTIVYHLDDPIRKFPEDVTGWIVGTPGSTGMADAMSALFRAGKRHLVRRRSGSDDDDVDDLLNKRIQGLMRGSFVGAALVRKYPNQLGMMPPWEAERDLGWGKAGEVFSFPCRRGSGLAALLNAHLLQLSGSGQLAALVEKHGMRDDL